LAAITHRLHSNQFPMHHAHMAVTKERTVGTADFVE
jgi:hypothetical protein